MNDALSVGYAQCAELTRRFGTTYYFGARILPAPQRRHVFAIYALCRLADDIVDAEHATSPELVAATKARLDSFEDRFHCAMREGATPGDCVMAAIRATVRGVRLPREYFDRFFGAMRQDLTVTSYATWDDLVDYMEGSAAVIGEMMVPVLGAEMPAAIDPARQLGFAFQLTNFLRDVGEDLDRGRVYLPAEDLDRFGVDVHERLVDDRWRAMMAFQIERNRDLYRRAEPGLALMPRPAARCVATAKLLYSQILDRIEERDHDVFTGRARVPAAVKLATAARGLSTRRPEIWGLA